MLWFPIRRPRASFETFAYAVPKKEKRTLFDDAQRTRSSGIYEQDRTCHGGGPVAVSVPLPVL